MDGVEDGINFIFMGFILQQLDIDFQVDVLTLQIEELVNDRLYFLLLLLDVEFEVLDLPLVQDDSLLVVLDFLNDHPFLHSQHHQFLLYFCYLGGNLDEGKFLLFNEISGVLGFVLVAIDGGIVLFDGRWNYLLLLF